jgi:hypothetical protein
LCFFEAERLERILRRALGSTVFGEGDLECRSNEKFDIHPRIHGDPY